MSGQLSKDPEIKATAKVKLQVSMRAKMKTLPAEISTCHHVKLTVRLSCEMSRKSCTLPA